MDADLKFVIYAPRFNEKNGGAIVLHKFCHMLNEIGCSACIWPYGLPRFTWRRPLNYALGAIAHYGSKLYRAPFFVSERYFTPIASAADLASCVVVYPEIVSGNPLHVPRYARWFLHRPGFHTQRVKYRPGDLYFSFQKAFDQPAPGMVDGGILRIREYMNDVYKKVNYGGRDKVCYVIRKGRSRSDVPNLSGLWVVDDLDHRELAKAFNQCQFCYFYDPYTMLSSYAAVCGCIPVIVPMEGVTKEMWKPDEELRFGLAYGVNDIDYAIETRDRLLSRLEQEEKTNIEMVQRFVSVVQAFFAHDNPESCS